MQNNDHCEDKTVRARELITDEVCIGMVPSMRPWYCPWKWCAITDEYKIYKRLLDYSLDTNADKDEILGMFHLIYVPAVAQLSYSAQASFERTLTKITDRRYDKNCLAKFALDQFCRDTWYGGASKAIKIMEIVSSSGSSFLLSLKSLGTIKAMSDLIVAEIISQYQAMGMKISVSDILTDYSKLFGEKAIMYLEPAVDVFCIKRSHHRRQV